MRRTWQGMKKEERGMKRSLRRIPTLLGGMVLLALLILASAEA